MLLVEPVTPLRDEPELRWNASVQLFAGDLDWPRIGYVVAAVFFIVCALFVGYQLWVEIEYVRAPASEESNGSFIIGMVSFGLLTFFFLATSFAKGIRLQRIDFRTSGIYVSAWQAKYPGDVLRAVELHIAWPEVAEVKLTSIDFEGPYRSVDIRPSVPGRWKALTLDNFDNEVAFQEFGVKLLAIQARAKSREL